MPRGASRKWEREYEELERKFHHEGRYRGREKEVAARIVNKQRAQYGATKEERRKDREGRSPDRGLPIRGYQELTVSEIVRRLGDLSDRQLADLRRYEAQHKQRKTLLEKLDRRLEH